MKKNFLDEKASLIIIEKVSFSKIEKIEDASFNFDHFVRSRICIYLYINNILYIKLYINLYI